MVTAVRLFRTISGSWLTFLCDEQIIVAAIRMSDSERRQLDEMIRRSLMGTRYVRLSLVKKAFHVLHDQSVLRRNL